MSNYLIFGQDAIEAAIEREKECKRRAYSFIYQQSKFMAYDKFLGINGFSEARKDAKEWVKNPEAGAIPTPGGRDFALLFDRDTREITVTTQAEAISEARAYLMEFAEGQAAALCYVEPMCDTAEAQAQTMPFVRGMNADGDILTVSIECLGNKPTSGKPTHALHFSQHILHF